MHEKQNQSTLQCSNNLLLTGDAHICLCSGLNPTYLSLFDNNYITKNCLLLKDSAWNNLYDPDSYFALFVMCHIERMSIHYLSKCLNECGVFLFILMLHYLIKCVLWYLSQRTRSVVAHGNVSKYLILHLSV